MKEQKQIYNLLKSAKAIVILTGAGMGVDSGLADYRGTGGQWGKVEKQTERSIFEIVNPSNLIENPDYLWTMFAHRLKEYSETIPHAGFDILKKWIEQFHLDYFIITSNIDGHFQKKGFKSTKIRELHGSIYYMQCSKPCSDTIWELKLNATQLLEDIKIGKYPQCPKCGAIARPNIYMFRDNTFLPNRTNKQEENFQQFINNNNGEQLIVFEIGSGPHVQSIRKKTRMLGIKYSAVIIRINPKDFKIKEPHIGINKGALEALLEIETFINEYKNG